MKDPCEGVAYHHHTVPSHCTALHTFLRHPLCTATTPIPVPVAVVAEASLLFSGVNTSPPTQG